MLDVVAEQIQAKRLDANHFLYLQKWYFLNDDAEYI